MDENVQLKEGEGSQFPMFLGEVHFVTAAASIHLPVMMRISLDYPNSVVCNVGKWMSNKMERGSRVP